MATTPDIEQIFAEHGPMITRIAATYEADPHHAADIVQEILVALWKALPHFRGEASLRTFVARIAHNRCVSHVVRQSKGAGTTELSADLPAADAGPESSAIQEERQQALLARIRRLPLAYRAPVTLTLEGFRPAEIAELLGVSVNAVGIRLTRAKALLADQFKDMA